MTRQLEPEWDDTNRNLVEGLARYEAELCQGCGLHPVVLDDPEHNHFTFDERLCAVCAAQDTYGRVLVDRDDKATPKDQHGQPIKQEPKVPRPGDGRHVFMRPMTADEIAKRVDPTNQRRPHGEPPRQRRP